VFVHGIHCKNIAPIAIVVLFLLGEWAIAQQPAEVQHASPSSRTSQVLNIVRDPADVPPSVGTRSIATVKVDLTAMEVVGELDHATGTTYRYWTFNGKVPGPMIRVRQDDTVEVTLHNDPHSRMVHSIDFHAAIGPGGGAALSQVIPGQQKTFTFQATAPGLFVYHCGTPMIADHIANGMYGLILVEPPGGLPHVDREYYVMQGEVYTTAAKGKSGLQDFSEDNLMKEAPQYFVFNGAVDALVNQHPLTAKSGETVRIFFGDAGPNEISSFHMVGEIFNHEYQLGSLSSRLEGVQTALVPPGGAAILELKASMAGQFNFMDHAMTRMSKGSLGTLTVSGKNVAELMQAGGATIAGGTPALTVSGLSTADRESHIESVSTMLHAPEGLSSKMSTAGDPNSISKTLSANSLSSWAPQSKATEPTQPGTVSLDGCFIRTGEITQLRLFHSTRLYDLEPRSMLLAEHPLAFAHDNQLVHVTGHFNPDAHLFGGHWFVVDTIDGLASSCNTTQSVAQLRIAAQREEAKLASAGSDRGEAIVKMGNMTFEPADITIDVGQTVLWKNTSNTVHNVIDDPAQALKMADVQSPIRVKPFGSGYLQPGQSYQRTFSVPGLYRYVCTLHETNGMMGTVVVRARGAVNVASAKKLR
jgi:copper-containing nitrite reductase